MIKLPLKRQARATFFRLVRYITVVPDYPEYRSSDKRWSLMLRIFKGLKRWMEGIAVTVRTAAFISQLRIFILALGLAGVGLARCPRAFADQNNFMFPPPAAVSKSISVNGRGFVINGRRTFIASGSLHYARVPRGLWADRLERMKRAGFNTVSTYIFWAYQEPKKGDYRFTGRRNLGAFLALVKKMHMHAILRMGPYNNGEWANGGLPNWLRFIPGMLVRSYNKPFLDALKPYFDRLFPIIVKNQITHGGPVVLVQIENEYFPGWGAVLNNRYLRWLHAMAIRKGINVPFFFSGLDQGFNPAGNQPFDTSGRPTPWFTTEMWSGWFNAYRNTNPVIRRLVTQSMWRVISFGGSGYNVFMAVGGSNFSHWNCRSVRASYAFGAPIGQAGDLRSSFYQYKRANFFARAFAPILEDSANATGSYHTYIKNAGKIRVSARKSPSGTLVFLMNPGTSRVTVNVPAGCPVTINPGQTVPVVLNFPAAPWLNFQQVSGQILGIEKSGANRTLVIYGDSGSRGQVRIGLAANAKVIHAPAAFKADKAKAGIYTLNVVYRDGAPQLFQMVTSLGRFQVVALSKSMADFTWFVHAAGKPLVVVGPAYLDSIHASGHDYVLRTELPLKAAVEPAFIISDAGLAAEWQPPKGGIAAADPAAPKLGPWQTRIADGPAQPVFNDSTWTKTNSPRQMGYPDYPGDYQWYRTRIMVKHAGPAKLRIPHLRDHGAVFVNGKIVAYGNPGELPVTLHAGDNTLAILAVAEARSKLFSIIGNFRNADRKGLWQNVRLLRTRVKKPSVAGGKPVSIVVSRVLGPWRMHGGMGPVDPASGWQAFSGAPGVVSFYRTHFTWSGNVGGVHTVLRVSPGSLSSGYMYINGHNLGRFPDFIMPMGLYLPSCWLKKGTNTLIILDDAGSSPAATKLVVETAASRRLVTVRAVN